MGYPTQCIEREKASERGGERTDKDGRMGSGGKKGRNGKQDTGKPCLLFSSHLSSPFLFLPFPLDSSPSLSPPLMGYHFFVNGHMKTQDALMEVL